MAKLEGGIFGTIRGKIGNTIYYQQKGKTLARKIGVSNKSSTPAQLTWRQKVKVLSAFFKPMKTLITTGFREAANGTQMNPYNAAIHYNVKRATYGEYPDVSLNYEQILLSKGSLRPASNVSVAKERDGLRFHWDNDQLDYQNRSDSAMLLLYFPAEQKAIYLLNAAQRQEGTAHVALATAQLIQEVHCYIAFIAAHRCNVSDSVYVGKLS